MIKPYKISVPKSTLNNIYKKVRAYPWKMMQNLSGWEYGTCLLYTSPSPRDYAASRMPSSA